MPVERSRLGLEVLLPVVTVILIVVAIIGIDVAAGSEPDPHATVTAALDATGAAAPATVTVTTTCECSMTTWAGVVDLASGAYRLDTGLASTASDGTDVWWEVEAAPLGLRGSWVALSSMTPDPVDPDDENPVACALDAVRAASTMEEVGDRYVGDGPDGTVEVWIDDDGLLERVVVIATGDKGDKTTDVTFEAYGRDAVELPAPGDIMDVPGDMIQVLALSSD